MMYKIILANKTLTLTAEIEACTMREAVESFDEITRSSEFQIVSATRMKEDDEA